MAAIKNSPILVVEMLDIVSLLPAAVAACRRGGGYYFHTAGWLSSKFAKQWLDRICGLKPCRFTDFPGSYFEANILTVNHANDIFCDAAFQREAEIVVSLLKRVHPHPLMAVALRRAVVERYTFLRIKTFVLLGEIAKCHSPIVFWPRDHWRLSEFLPKNMETGVSENIAEKGRWMCRWRAFIDRGGILLFLFAAPLYLMLTRPLCLKKPSPQSWKVGFDILNCGLFWDFPHHDDLVYDENDLSPKNILHVVRNRLQDKKTRRHFKDQGIPFVEATALPLPMAYLFHRVLGLFMGGMLVATWRTLANPRSLPFLKEGARLLMAVLPRAELLDSQFPTDVFVGRDEYGVAHIIRTMLHDQRGGRTMGFTHGDILFPEVALSYLSWHVFCATGEFEKDLLAQHTAHCRRVAVIGAGVYGLDFSFRMRCYPLPETHPYSALKKKGKLVGVFGTNACEDDYISEAVRRRFYYWTVRSLKPYPDVIAMLRPKREDADDLSWPRRLAERNERVVVDDPTWTYDALPWFDLVICMSISTVGIEALMAGVPVIYFDETGLPDHPYERFAPAIVARTPEALRQRLEDFLVRGRYMDDRARNTLREKHGGWFDGKTRDRFRSEVRRLMSETTPRSTKA